VSNLLDFQQPRPEVAEMQERIHDIIKEYDVSFHEVLGVLTFLKIIMTARQIDNMKS